MDLQLSTAFEEDIRSLISILGETTLESDWGKAQLGSIAKVDLERLLESDLQDCFRESKCITMTVKDASTGEIISFIQLEGPPLADSSDVQIPSVSHPNRKPVPKPVGFNMAATRSYFSTMIEVRKRQTHDLTYIRIVDLATRHAFRRQGAAKMLLSWATDHAQRCGYPLYMESTPSGQDLYQKMGFEILERFKVDLSPYGDYGMYEEVAMIWRCRA